MGSVADQEVLVARPPAMEPSQTDAPAITGNFKIHEVDEKLLGNPSGAFRALAVGKAVDPPGELGVLSNFHGTFHGTGFNTIFRPKSSKNQTVKFPNLPLVLPAGAPDDNILELNLTKETLAFAPQLGNVPNRGLNAQADITLNGVPYMQTINDVTNIQTGKSDATETNIHFEPGLWMHVPATTDPQQAATLSRMASIPHGTTINAQCIEPTTTVAGPPTFQPADMTPFVIGQTKPLPKFPSQTAATKNTSRLPQDLSKFISTGAITQAMLDDPNTVLANDIKGKTITKTIVFKVSTSGPSTKDVSGGLANISFLEGTDPSPVPTSADKQPNANANAVQMTATFWIETVQYKLQLPTWKFGQPPMNLAPTGSFGGPVPLFQVKPDHDITSSKTITVESKQIQYSQQVNLNFAGLTWPHISVATLVPQGFQVVPSSAVN